MHPASLQSARARSLPEVLDEFQALLHRVVSLTRLRPVLMTSFAMIAGMTPMALAIGRGSAESAPLGRAVIGGLLAATLATLFILPTIFGFVQRRAALESPSLDPDDPNSRFGQVTETAK